LPDPEGELFYNEKSDLTGPSTFYYYATREINPFDNKVVAHIIFYTSSVNQPVAEVCLVSTSSPSFPYFTMLYCLFSLTDATQQFLGEDPVSTADLAVV
jgi:hypothetical protein